LESEVILAVSAATAMSAQAIQAGASAYLLKDTSLDIR